MARKTDAIHSPEFQHRTTIRSVGGGRIWCESCAGWVSGVTIEQASTLARFPVGVLLDRIVRRDLHFIGTPNGDFLFCLDMLSEVFRRN